MKRITIRARLTLIYSVLLVLAGGVLLGVTYVLVAQSLNRRFGPPAPNLLQGADITIPTDQLDAIRRYARTVQRDSRHNALESVLTQGGIALVVVTVAAVALSWFIAGRALAPLNQITGTARRIARAGAGARGLHERIALSGPKDEVKELADTFDLMLERLDRSFDGQQRFVANASHELRTPLAINRSLVEVAITRPDASADTRRLGEALLLVNERHERLIDGLLTLADSENQIRDPVALDLADVARHVVEGGAPDGITVSCRLDAAPTAGDPVLLERLTQNLVENAIRHNVPAGRVCVSTDTDDNRVRLVVTNTGPPVPEYEVEELFKPFHRLRVERTDRGRGFGLGLSIVRAIAHAHGGRAAAVPGPDGGLVVTVTLPARAPGPAT